MNIDYSSQAKKYTKIALICAVLFFVLKPVIFAFIPFDYTINATIIYAIVGYLPAFIIGDIALYFNLMTSKNGQKNLLYTVISIAIVSAGVVIFGMFGVVIILLVPALAHYFSKKQLTKSEDNL